MDAKREAIRDGANPIELVDGEKLVRMFEKLELGRLWKTPPPWARMAG
jgi:restriction system protein